MRTLRDVVERHIEPEPMSGCWLWMGFRYRNGYGQGYRPRRGNPHHRPEMAHRLVYEAYREPVPADLTIDHLCRNKACVNPAHLEVVTQRENSRRAHEKPECEHGHAFTPENTYVWRGRRACKACRLRVQRAAFRRHHPDSGIALGKRTHCPLGHEYTPENTYIQMANGLPKRSCKICRRAAVMRSQAKRRAG